jgi:hypothetical protein
MASVRHRRRVRLTRFVAAVAPLAALALAGAAFVLEDRWLPAAAAAAGAVLSLVLAAMLLRLDRRWRLEVAMARAAQAAEYAAEYERYTSVHRSFTSHMIGLLDAASDRLGVQRRRIEALEAEVTGLRVARPAAADPTPALATFAEGPEWNELWPDLADAPTVVDLLKWDERMQHALLPDADADDHRDERTA